MKAKMILIAPNNSHHQEGSIIVELQRIGGTLYKKIKDYQGIIKMVQCVITCRLHQTKNQHPRIKFSQKEVQRIYKLPCTLTIQGSRMFKITKVDLQSTLLQFQA